MIMLWHEMLRSCDAADNSSNEICFSRNACLVPEKGWQYKNYDEADGVSVGFPNKLHQSG